MTTLARVGQARRCAPGETVCGDVAAVRSDGPAILVCLADGLGHGPEAAAAAEAACRHALERPALPLDAILRALDAALAGTRGAAASVMRVDARAGSLEFAGVGNVALRALAAARPAGLLSPGILGRGVRRVRSERHALARGDLLVLHTDGVESRFDLEPYAGMDVQCAADAIVASHRRGRDDAACVVVRYVGGGDGGGLARDVTPARGSA